MKYIRFAGKIKNLHIFLNSLITELSNSITKSEALTRKEKIKWKKKY